MLGWTKNTGHNGMYDFFLYIVGLKKKQTYRIRTSSKTRNDSKSFSINKQNIHSTQYF